MRKIRVEVTQRLTAPKRWMTLVRDEKAGDSIPLGSIVRIGTKRQCETAKQAAIDTLWSVGFRFACYTEDRDQPVVTLEGK